MNDIDDPRILSFRCAHCLDEYLPDEMYASLTFENAVICYDCRVIEETEIFDEFGEFKLNVLINRYGSKLDYQTESDIPSKSYRYNTFNIEDLDYYLDDYDEFDR